ncbi:DUF1670 domain-containing protein [Methanogenium sp. MK-MG]|uniref:DUF1670 domain-containing protein n=1 Tax=Methanogenium sp. MK-MG TaxID=2599926 RepID=UPI0013EDC542|nr:DUF1670 domain-containing protein [Methanogenium sp. MK-MG]KAF1078747.1 hypothetical protein MKMG_00297 [Methanogenium sp. MK-MG]
MPMQRTEVPSLRSAWTKTKEYQFLAILEEEYGFKHPTSRSLVHLMNEFAEESYGWHRGDMQIIYRAVDMREPPGRAFGEIPLRPVLLTISVSEDATAFEKGGLQGMRQHKLIRLAREAYDQGGMLAQHDLALLLTTSSRTIQRDIKELRCAGIRLPTRGAIYEYGHIPSIRSVCVDRFLCGEKVEDTALECGVSTDMVRKYHRQFTDTVVLYARSYRGDEIIDVTGVPEKVVGEFLILYECHKNRKCPRLNEFFTRYTPGTIQRPVPFAPR